MPAPRQTTDRPLASHVARRLGIHGQLVGRQSELRRLTTELVRAQGRIITLVGRGGIGKTALAAATVRSMGDTREVVAVALDRLDPSEPVLDAVAVALGLRPEARDEAQTIVERSLASAPMLLVLDGVDRHPEVVEVAGRLVDACPDLRVLVTSRTPLHMTEELVIRVPPLDAASAVELFCSVADTGGMPVASTDRDVVAAICAELGGEPLALSLAAARLLTMTPAALLRAVQRAPLDVLRGGRRGPARHRRIDTTLAWTLDLLDPQTQRLLAIVAAHTSPITIEEIAEAVDAAGLSGSTHVIDGCSLLVDHHLLDVERLDTGSIFQTPRLVRDHLANAIPASERATTDDARDRALCGFAHRAIERHFTVDDVELLATLERRRTDLEHAIARRLAVGDVTAAADLVLALMPFWNDCGRHDQARAAIANVRSASGATGVANETTLVLDAWDCFFRAHRVQPPSDLGDEFERLVVRAVESRDRRVVLLVCSRSVLASLASDHREVAAAHAQIGIEHASARDDRYARANFQLWAAMLATQLSRFDEAAALAEAALSSAREIGNDSVMGYAIMTLANLPSSARRPDLEVPRVARALELVAADRHARAHILPASAMEHLMLGDTETAGRTAAEGIRLASRLGLTGTMSVGSLLVVLVALARGHTVDAVTLHGALHDRLEVALRAVPPQAATHYRRSIEAAASSLAPAERRAALSAGAAMRWHEVTALAIRIADPCTNPAEAAGTSEATGARSPLTPRERDVLAALVAGRSNKQIAADLGITIKTAMHHTSNIYRKLGVRTRSEAVAWALTRGRAV